MKTNKGPSAREITQAEIAAWLLAHQDRFTAPYGVLSGIEAVPKGGKIRTITFGIARSLDATLLIWSANRISVSARGGASSKFDSVPNRTFTSAADFKARMTDLFLKT